MAHRYEMMRIVLPSHLDDMKHVNNVVYVQFMQDVAYEHWRSVVTPEFLTEIVWVVRRHEIDYHAAAFLNDQLLIKTWTAAQFSGVTWDRHYEIFRISDNRKLITAKSSWVLLDKQTGRPRRIDESVRALFD